VPEQLTFTRKPSGLVRGASLVDMCGRLRPLPYSNLARSIYLGEPPAWLRTAMDLPRQLAEGVRAEMRPGMPLRELLELDARLGKELGIWQDQWWLGGYELGIALAPTSSAMWPLRSTACVAARPREHAVGLPRSLSR